MGEEVVAAATAAAAAAARHGGCGAWRGEAAQAPARATARAAKHRTHHLTVPVAIAREPTGRRTDERIADASMAEGAAGERCTRLRCVHAGGAEWRATCQLEAARAAQDSRASGLAADAS